MLLMHRIISMNAPVSGIFHYSPGRDLPDIESSSVDGDV